MKCFLCDCKTKKIMHVHIREHGSVLGSTVVSPYVGMARKQNGGYNASISVQTLIFHSPGGEFYASEDS